jgi:type IV pilus assembly protein PilQ
MIAFAMRLTPCIALVLLSLSLPRAQKVDTLPWAQKAKTQSEAPAPTPKKLSEQEREMVELHKRNATKAKAKQPKVKAPAEPIIDSTRLTVDYVDEPIQDVLRAIATGFRLNLIPDKDIGEIKITIHLENIPVMEGLKQICRTHGLDLIEEGSLLRVRRTQEAVYSFMDVRNGKMNLDVRHKPIRDFLREFGDRTKVNVVPAQNLQGKVNGQLQLVDPLDGLKALMAANGFDVRLKNGVYLVETQDSSSQTRGGLPGFNRGARLQGNGGGDIDVQNGQVTLTLTNASLNDALREIAEEAGLNYAMIGEVQGSVTAHLRNVPVEKAMTTLLQGTRYAFIKNDNTLLIGDRNINTPSGVALSTAELLYLKYIKVENIDKIFPKTISQENIKVIREQNAVLVSGTREEIEQVRSFINQVDLPTPQVLLEVLVVEYNRRQDSELGIGPGKTDYNGVNLNAYGNMSGVESKWTNGGWQGVIGFLPPKFDLSLRALESKNKAKVLAMPKVTTMNGNKAELKVAKTSYYQVSSFSKDGLQNNDYRSFDDGINIELTPWVTRHGEVNVQISPSIKTAGAPEGNSPAPITNRSITTNVTLMDGQTIALGGLIQSQEENVRSFVPILGSIPVLGYLFSSRKLIKINSELVIYVTPHILVPESQGIELEEELGAIEKRAGFIKTRDFIKSDEKPVKPAPADTAQPAAP